MSVKISKLNVKIGKKEVSLTIEEAKELQKILNDTFGEQKTVFVPSSSIIIERPVISPWKYWGVTWTGDTSENAITYSLNSAA